MGSDSSGSLPDDDDTLEAGSGSCSNMISKHIPSTFVIGPVSDHFLWTAQMESLSVALLNNMCMTVRRVIAQGLAGVAACEDMVWKVVEATPHDAGCSYLILSQG